MSTMLLAPVQSTQLELYESPLCPCLTSLSALSNASLSIAAEYGIVNASTYGLGCAAHDLARPVCNGEDEPAICAMNIFPQPPECHSRTYCPSKFCYVDPDNCQLEHVGSSFFRATRTFSYGACGNLDSWTGAHRSSGALRGRVLRAAYFSNSGGWIGAYHPDGVKGTLAARDDRWTGPVAKLTELMAKELGFYPNVTEQPAAIRTNSRREIQSTSDWTDCVYAVSLGYLDYCVGMFTYTTQRAAIAPYFVLETHPVYAITVESRRPLLSGISLVTSPMSGAVWALLFGTLALVTFTFAKQEGGLAGSMFDDSDFGSERSSARGCTPRVVLRWLLKGLKNQIESFYFGMRSLFGGAVEHQAVSWGGRITLMALGLFILFSLTVYTATLTSQMVVRAQHATFNSFAEARNAGVPMCVDRVLYRVVHASYPSEAYVPMPNRSAVFDAMVAGECLVGVVWSEDLHEKHGKGAVCNMLAIGDPIMHIARGIPMARWVVAPLSLMLQTMKANGIWQGILDDMKPVDRCAVSRASTSVQVTLNDFLGQALIVMVLVLVGAAHTLCTKSADGPQVLPPSERVAKASLSRQPTQVLRPQATVMRIHPTDPVSPTPQPDGHTPADGKHASP